MPKKILICDDDEGVLDVLNIILKGDGYDVVQVRNSDEIFDSIKQFEPQLILLDLWMPSIDGEEVTKSLKKDPKTMDIPIILISANRDIAKKTEETGAQDFLAKPFNMCDLEDLVKKYLEAEVTPVT